MEAFSVDQIISKDVIVNPAAAADGELIDVAYQLIPFFRAFKDGRVHRFFGTDFVHPDPSHDTPVSFKDVLIHPDTGVSARLFKPRPAGGSGSAQLDDPTPQMPQSRRLPLLIYIHGGAFCVGSPFCPTYHNLLTSIVSQANVLAVSVDYRLAPENPLPAAYDDAWAVLNWVATHANGNGPDEWVNEYADLGRIYIAGESAGANIAHNASVRAGLEGLPDGVNLVGGCLVHPDFASKDRVLTDVWAFANPTSAGLEDPHINPSKDPGLSKIPWKRALVMLTERDFLREGGLFYYETMKELSGWGGCIEMIETKEEEHAFHLFNPTCQKAVDLIKTMASFLNN